MKVNIVTEQEAYYDSSENVHAIFKGTKHIRLLWSLHPGIDNRYKWCSLFFVGCFMSHNDLDHCSRVSIEATYVWHVSVDFASIRTQRCN